MLKCTRAITLLGRAQVLFPYRFRPPEVKLQTWPSLIRDRRAPQVRHAHAYSEAMKPGLKSVKEDLTVWKISKWIGTVVVGGVFLEFGFSRWYNYRNESILLRSFEHGFCPESDVMRERLIYRKAVIKKLKRIFESSPEHSTYHIVIGKHGTGKTTMVRQSAREVGKGVIYIDVSPVSDMFIMNLARAIGYKFNGDYVSLVESLNRKITGNDNSKKALSMYSLVMNAFERGAREYKKKNGKPPVLILDNIKQSSYSRADPDPIVIGEITNEEAFDYLHNKLGIEEKVAKQLIQLIGGRIRDLLTFGEKIKNGYTFEEVRESVLGVVSENFDQAEIEVGGSNYAAGKRVIQELMKNEKIDFHTFKKLVNDKQMADALLQANVFSYNPKSKIITFQSRATKLFVGEHPEIFG
ncbi:hypothetical protein Glove_139g39 [Diversispora epigaea]|uniref:ATPase AAA-type core domain-containing protein n=1 Tax=Diversispora epigaea TaxID=1348612 RepID=A0A397J4A7_9GLOM|nr:hypothetical protein Glove_139g39 [Diversispora epigaea]